LGGSAWWYATIFELANLETVKVTIRIPGIPTAFIGTKIVLISDFHLGRTIRTPLLRAAIDHSLALKPDLLVIAGDLVQRIWDSEPDILADELDRIEVPLGAYAVLGNHDYHPNAGVVAQAVQSTGVRLLRNDAVPLQRNDQQVYLAGIESVMERRHNLPMAMRAVPAGAPTILLAHEPDFADEAVLDQRIVLQLSGHSHGGQVRMLGAPLRLPRYAQKYPEGLYRVGSTWLYTNRGIGVAGVPIRVNCPPEVTLIELQSAA
jgi:hypothetical protein